MDYKTLLKAAQDKDFGTFEEGLKAVLFAKSLGVLNERAMALTEAISLDREPTDMSDISPSLFLPNLKEHIDIDLPSLDKITTDKIYPGGKKDDVDFQRPWTQDFAKKNPKVGDKLRATKAPKEINDALKTKGA